MKKDESLLDDVQHAMAYEPSLRDAEIGVTAKSGIVTLTGLVKNYALKLQAENVAKKVKGVRAVVEKIELTHDSSYKRPDHEIAADVLHALRWNWNVPDDKIMVKVENGWVTLEGKLRWNYQREAARHTVANIEGVCGISNELKLDSEIKDKLEQKSVERALAANWATGDEKISVKVSDSKVSLSGSVHSLYAKEQAGRIAWKAPGVVEVDNGLTVAVTK